MDTQPNNEHTCLLATNYCVGIVCRVLIIAAYLGNKIIFRQLSLLTLQVTVNSCNAAQTIIHSSVLDTVPIKEIYFRNTAEGGKRTRHI